MVELLSSLELKTIYWLIPVVQLIHELEEWNILKWYKNNFEDIPASTNFSTRFWIILFSLFAYVWVTICFFIQNLFISALLISLVLIITTLNSLQHIYWQILFKKYAPGVVTSILLVLPLNLYVTYRIVHQDLVPAWLLLIISFPILPGIIQTFRAKNKMTKVIRVVVHELPLKLIEKFSG